jgi:hypothetical protein
MRNILCLLGFHKWRYIPKKVIGEHKGLIPNGHGKEWVIPRIHKSRLCTRCPKTEIFSDVNIQTIDRWIDL